ncbi:primase-helicase family protein [Lysobacter soli]|uniref:primase-helicase family protein n=1 Tax=Lysobacter soli TaxID=453783 RepID=UPI0037CB31A5
MIVHAANEQDLGIEVPDHITELNLEHAVVLMGDKAVILRETRNDRGARDVRFLAATAMKTYFSNRTVVVDTLDGHGRLRSKQVPVFDDWMRSPRRRSYAGVTFAPSNNLPADYYNLWGGFAVPPLDCGLLSAALKCRRLLAHLKVNVCNGNREHFRYLLAWTADMMQAPDEKKGVALVLRGEKGVGKSTFSDVVRSLLGEHAIKVSHMRHLTGNFNRHLSDKLLIVAEESFWAGDKGDEGPLKDMITSDTLTVEAKGIDAVEIRSLCRIIMVTNSEWAVPATGDERRYFVLDVGSARRQDHDYFAAIHRQLNSTDREGLRALLTFLLRFPIARYNLRRVPETVALRSQRTLSLDLHAQFILDSLLDRRIAGVCWDWGAIVSKDAVYDAYCDAAKKRGKSHLLAPSVFAKQFIAATGARTTRPRVGGSRASFWDLPAWEDSAVTFEARYRVDVRTQAEPVVELDEDPF